MKKLVNAFSLVLISALLASPALAQEKQKTSKPKPDFTGTWLLDRAKSTIGPAILPDLPLKIVHHDPELHITEQIRGYGKSIIELDFVYYSDERGEMNQSTVVLRTGTDKNKPGGYEDVTKSRTRWSGDKLVIRSTRIVAGRPWDHDHIDEWKLSKDGKTLTETSHVVFHPDLSGAIYMPEKQPDSKRVFNRLPD